MNVLLFAQLSELTGAREIAVAGMNDTNALVAYLNEHYQGFFSAVYVIAVEKEVIHENTELTDQSTVAFLPPYSGG